MEPSHNRQSIEYKLLNQIKRYVACCKHKTIRCYSTVIGIQLFISLVCNSTIRTGFQIQIQELVMKIGVDKQLLHLSNSTGCYRWVSGCRFCCQNIFIVSVGVANNFTILQCFVSEFKNYDGNKNRSKSSINLQTNQPYILLGQGHSKDTKLNHSYEGFGILRAVILYVQPHYGYMM